RCVVSSGPHVGHRCAASCSRGSSAAPAAMMASPPTFHILMLGLLTMATRYFRTAYPAARHSLSCRPVFSEGQTGPMLARHRSNPEDKADAREKRDAGQDDQQISRCDDRFGALG